MMKTVGSIFIVLVLLLVLPITLMNWTIKLTLLQSSFYENVLQQANGYDTAATIVTDTLLSNQPTGPQLQPYVLAVLHTTIPATFFYQTVNTNLTSAWSWFQSSNNLTQLNLGVSLAAIKQILPEQLHTQLLNYWTSLPDCVGTDVTKQTSEDRGDSIIIPNCKTNVADGETIASMVRDQIQQPLHNLPDQLSMQTYVQQANPAQLQQINQQVDQVRQVYRSFMLSLMITTVLALLCMVGLFLIHLKQPRSGLRWASLPTLISSGGLATVALIAYLSGHAIVDFILNNANLNVSAVTRTAILTLATFFITHLALVLLCISGGVAAVMLILYIVSFFVHTPQSNKPAPEK